MGCKMLRLMNCSHWLNTHGHSIQYNMLKEILKVSLYKANCKYVYKMQRLAPMKEGNAAKWLWIGVVTTPPCFPVTTIFLGNHLHIYAFFTFSVISTSIQYYAHKNCVLQKLYFIGHVCMQAADIKENSYMLKGSFLYATHFYYVGHLWISLDELAWEGACGGDKDGRILIIEKRKCSY